MEKIKLSMSFTEEEAKAIKKAFEQVSMKLYHSLRLSGSGAKKRLLIGGSGKKG